MQSLSPVVSYRGVFATLQGMMKQEGVFRPVRGKFSSHAPYRVICLNGIYIGLLIV